MPGQVCVQSVVTLLDLFQLYAILVTHRQYGNSSISKSNAFVAYYMCVSLLLDLRHLISLALSLYCFFSAVL